MVSKIIPLYKTVPRIINFKKLANEKTVFNGGSHHDVVLFGC